MASAADLPRLNESAGRCRYTHSSSFSSSQNVLPSMSGIRVNSSITSRTVGLVMEQTSRTQVWRWDFTPFMYFPSFFHIFVVAFLASVRSNTALPRGLA